MIIGGKPYVTREILEDRLGEIQSQIDMHHPPYASLPKTETFTLLFNKDALLTHPDACLTYGEGCVGNLPITNVGSTAMQNATLGSWTPDHPMLTDCYYCTVDENGNEVSALNPYDLTFSQDLSEDTEEQLSTYDVMFCIPKRHVLRNAYGITHSLHSFEGSQCLAHTLGDTEFDKMYIAVYPTCIQDNIAHSWSGVVPARFYTRAQFRNFTKAKNATVDAGVWCQMNWHHYSLVRDMTLFATKSFNVQYQLGQGYSFGGNRDNYIDHLTGSTNHFGMFAGCTSTTTSGPEMDVRCFVESFWANGWDFIDDMDINPGYQDGTPRRNIVEVYAGHNHPDDIVCESDPASNNANKELVGEVNPPALPTGSASSAFYAGTINTTPLGWGIPRNNGGSTTTGTCDNNWTRGGESTGRVPLVDGASNAGSDYGICCWNIARDLTYNGWETGSRMVFLR